MVSISSYNKKIKIVSFSLITYCLRYSGPYSASEAGKYMLPFKNLIIFSKFRDVRLGITLMRLCH